MCLCRVFAVIVACVLYGAEVAGQGQPNVRKLHGAFLAGALLRDDVAHGVGGVELEFGAGRLRPSVGGLFGDDTAALGIGVAWHGFRISSKEHVFIGAGASIHDVYTHPVYARVGFEHSRHRDIGFRIEARTYAFPFLPALLIGIVLPASKS
jgi:hypothetical protein